jgi:hypothetical protein
MEKLQQAEQIDHFFFQVSQNPVNAKAREQHSYVPMSDVLEPYLLNTQIIKLHPTAEAGLPHTRPPNLICIPMYYPEDRMDLVLKHELIHIDQRRRWQKWNAFFQRQGWSISPISEIPSRWLQRCRLNPDTIDEQFWAWRDRHVPLPLYEREDRPDLRSVSIRWWDKETGFLQTEAPRSFQERFGRTPSQPEHPRELAAVELAEIFQTPSDIDSYLASE